MFWLMWLTMAMDFEVAGQINLSQFDIYSSNLEMFITQDHVIAILVDSSEKAMLLIDENGKLIAKCGRQGQGPREFQSPDAVWWDHAENSFAVFDSDNARISKWEKDGRFNSASPCPHKIKKPRLKAPNSLVYLRNARGLFPEPPALMIVDLEKGKPKTLWEVEERRALPSVKVEGSVMVVSTDWDPRLHFGLGSDFIAATFTNDDEVLVLDLDGNLRTKFSAKFKQFEVSDADIDRQIENSFSFARGALKAKRSQLYEGKIWPEIRSVFVDRKDRIWLIGQRDREVPRRFPIAIYDTKGELVDKGEVAHEPVFVAGGSLFTLKETGGAVVLEHLKFFSD